MSRAPRLASKLVGLCLALSGCTAETSAPADPRPVPTAGPALGAADSLDSPDRECAIVLRSVGRERSGPGFESWCASGGPCWQVFRGVVDVATAALDDGSVPFVTFRSLARPETWWEVSTLEVTGAPRGFRRFLFVLGENTIEEGISATAIARSRIELVPFLRRPSGARVFDHNRHPGDFDNYVLTYDSGFSVGDDAAVCPAERPRTAARIEFRGDWEELQRGTIVRGGTLRVDYALTRLPQCQDSSYSGYAAWNTTGYARFSPSGQVVEANLVEREDMFGHAFHSKPFELEVPSDAESVDLWFMTSGLRCTATYDSNYGENYRFAVADRAPAPVAWAGDVGNGMNRQCEHRAGIADPYVLDSYVAERACMFVDVDVYVPGLTDAATLRPEALVGEVRQRLDEGEASMQPLTFVERVGNNYRFRWQLERQTLRYATWSSLHYDFRFSTDGVEWYSLARADGTPFEMQRGPGF